MEKKNLSKELLYKLLLSEQKTVSDDIENAYTRM